MAAPYNLQDTAIGRQKAAIRARLLASRATPPARVASAIMQRVLAELVLPACVAGVWPLPGELDVRPLWHALHERGHRIVLPETPPRGQPLRFRAWQPGCMMLRERFGTLRPDGPEACPDLIFVPLLAFDDDGYRLGYGGGFYDRTLAAMPGIPTLGFACDAQQIAAVPRGPHDMRLDQLVTETRLLRWDAPRSSGLYAHAAG